MCITPCHHQKKVTQKSWNSRNCKPSNPKKFADKLPSTTLRAMKHDQCLLTTTRHRMLPRAIFGIHQLSRQRAFYYTGGGAILQNLYVARSALSAPLTTINSSSSRGAWPFDKYKSFGGITRISNSPEPQKTNGPAHHRLAHRFVKTALTRISCAARNS